MWSEVEVWIHKLEWLRWLFNERVVVTGEPAFGKLVFLQRKFNHRTGQKKRDLYFQCVRAQQHNDIPVSNA